MTCRPATQRHCTDWIASTVRSITKRPSWRRRYSPPALPASAPKRIFSSSLATSHLRNHRRRRPGGLSNTEERRGANRHGSINRIKLLNHQLPQINETSGTGARCLRRPSLFALPKIQFCLLHNGFLIGSKTLNSNKGNFYKLVWHRCITIGQFPTIIAASS